MLIVIFLGGLLLDTGNITFCSQHLSTLYSQFPYSKSCSAHWCKYEAYGFQEM